MKINALNMTRKLVKLYVIKPLKASAGDMSNPMIRNQKVFLPSHEDVLSLIPIRRDEGRILLGRAERVEVDKSLPVLEVGLLRTTPFGTIGLEGVARGNHFAFEVGGEGRVFVREAFDAEIAAQEGFLHVDVFQLDLNFILRLIGGLFADKGATGAEI